MLTKPTIYLSITTTDLGKCRALARNVLLRQYIPVEPPRDLPPSPADARALLRAQIAACDTVVCIIGKHYGSEPDDRPATEPRLSHRQLEYDIARQLRKNIILFICDDHFDYDPDAPAEPADSQQLQQTHRAQLLAGKTIYTPVANTAELKEKLQDLRVLVDALNAAARRAQIRFWLTIAASALAALLLAAGLWFLIGKMQTTETTVTTINETLTQLNAEVTRQATLLDAVASAFVNDQPEADRLNIPPDEQFKNAIAKVAERENIPPALLSAQIKVFVKNTRAAGDAASELDRARADFAARDYSAAAKGATRAALALRVQRLSAADAAATATTQATQLRQKAAEIKTFADDLQSTPTPANPATQ